MSAFNFNDYKYTNIDSEEEESTDIWTSPSSSQGRSSIGSIPWAEDAIKQNQEEWEAIEQMFYGERELPKNTKIREEFLEWMTKFPHLRVVGHSLQIESIPHTNTEYVEEIIAIDPEPIKHPTSSKSNQLLSLIPHSLSKHKLLKRTKSTLSECDNKISSTPKNTFITHSTDLPYEIERCLRITSGPLLTRNAQISGGFRQHHKLPDPLQRYFTPAIHEEIAQTRVASVRSDSLQSHTRSHNKFNYHLKSNYHETHPILKPINLPITLSARIMKMPPIISKSSESILCSSNSSKSAKPVQSNSYARNCVILPAIHRIQRNDSSLFQAEIIGRSISATNSTEA